MEMWIGVFFCDTSLGMTCMHDDMKAKVLQVS